MMPPTLTPGWLPWRGRAMSIFNPASLATVLLTVCLAPPAASAGDFDGEVPTVCDLLAAHPSDPDRITEGRSQAEIMPDIERTIAACRRDTDRHDAVRLTYYLGRVLFYQGNVEAGLELVDEAAALGHRQSQFVSALIRLEGVPDTIPADPCHSQDLWVDAASNGHYGATLTLARHQASGAFHDCESGPAPAQILEWLDVAAEHERADDYYHGLLIGLLRNHLND